MRPSSASTATPSVSRFVSWRAIGVSSANFEYPAITLRDLANSPCNIVKEHTATLTTIFEIVAILKINGCRGAGNTTVRKLQLVSAAASHQKWSLIDADTARRRIGSNDLQVCFADCLAFRHEALTGAAILACCGEGYANLNERLPVPAASANEKADAVNPQRKLLIIRAYE